MITPVLVTMHTQWGQNGMAFEHMFIRWIVLYTTMVIVLLYKAILYIHYNIIVYSNLM